ncbi:hypothetical protein QWZ15_20340 [Cyclobacterium jeungdonense]|uniref:Uncharacterized protein n=1 Tax=Cyclobacterium jeungdonense TaxID=708087 RepID=A0ABT8CCQ4_9BACT|nr:hypothetical protein [Cyclobacterium jeungdonense]MDN3690182.1 hypothetical protein [Cyclobacterium jeungdonense]
MENSDYVDLVYSLHIENDMSAFLYSPQSWLNEISFRSQIRVICNKLTHLQQLVKIKVSLLN